MDRDVRQSSDGILQKRSQLVSWITTAVRNIARAVHDYTRGDLELEWRVLPEAVRESIVAKSRTKQMGEES